MANLTAPPSGYAVLVHEQRRIFVLLNRSTNDWWQRGTSTLDKFCRDNAVELDRMMHEVKHGNGGHGK